MQIKGVIWVGSVCGDREATASFFADVLGMETVTNVKGFTRLRMENGDRLELFDVESAEHEQIDAVGPIAGFWVDDAEEARAEMVAAGVESCTQVERGPDGHGWFYFKAPDDRYYEICESPRPRPVKGS